MHSHLSPTVMNYPGTFPFHKVPDGSPESVFDCLFCYYFSGQVGSGKAPWGRARLGWFRSGQVRSGQVRKCPLTRMRSFTWTRSFTWLRRFFAVILIIITYFCALIFWLAGSLAGWLPGWLTDWLTYWLTDKLTYISYGSNQSYVFFVSVAPQPPRWRVVFDDEAPLHVGSNWRHIHRGPSCDAILSSMYHVSRILYSFLQQIRITTDDRFEIIV